MTASDPNEEMILEFAPVWARHMFRRVMDRLDSISTQEAATMAQVQIDDGVLKNAVTTLGNVNSALESLSSAVEAFLNNNPNLPQADVTTLNDALTGSQQALTDSQTAHTDLTNATPTPAPTPTPPAGP